MSHGQCKENSLFSRPERVTKRQKTLICKQPHLVREKTSPVLKPHAECTGPLLRYHRSLLNRTVSAAKVDLTRDRRLNCSALPNRLNEAWRMDVDKV